MSQVSLQKSPEESQDSTSKGNSPNPPISNSNTSVVSSASALFDSDTDGTEDSLSEK